MEDVKLNVFTDMLNEILNFLKANYVNTIAGPGLFCLCCVMFYIIGVFPCLVVFRPESEKCQLLLFACVGGARAHILLVAL